MSWTAISTVIAAIAAIVAMGALLWSVFETKRATRLAMFTEYTRRYQEIMLKIPTTVFAAEFKLDELGAEKREDVMRALRAYFDICWEELHLNTEKKLDSKVWQYWQNGMLDILRFPAFEQAWNSIERDRYYGKPFHDFVADVGSGRLGSD